MAGGGMAILLAARAEPGERRLLPGPRNRRLCPRHDHILGSLSQRKPSRRYPRIRTRLARGSLLADLRGRGRRRSEPRRLRQIQHRGLHLAARGLRSDGPGQYRPRAGVGRQPRRPEPGLRPIPRRLVLAPSRVAEAEPGRTSRPPLPLSGSSRKPYSPNGQFCHQGPKAAADQATVARRRSSGVDRARLSITSPKPSRSPP